jgi:cation diffusion facilitator CzcD-associated flavoprotein CzcO
MKAKVTELRSQTGQESIFHGAIVIGAGAASAGRRPCAEKAGVPTLVLEKESRLAELWYRRHERLHLNSPRDLRHCLASTIPQALPRPTQNCAQAFAVASPMPASRPTQSRSRSPGRGDD